MTVTETTVAYRCPHCSQAVVGKVNLLKVRGNKLVLKCSCGESSMETTLSSDGKVRITAPCIFCPTPHYYTVSEDVFFSDGLFELGCSMTGFPACFVGPINEVSDALEENENELRRIAAEAGVDLDSQRLAPDENSLKEQVLRLLGELKAENRIICLCEDGKDAELSATLSDEGVTICCKRCGAQRFFRAKTTLDCEYLSEIDLLYLE